MILLHQRILTILYTIIIRPSLFERTRHRINHANDDTFSDRIVIVVGRSTVADRKTFFNIATTSSWSDFIITRPDDFNIEIITLFSQKKKQ